MYFDNMIRSYFIHLQSFKIFQYCEALLKYQFK